MRLHPSVWVVLLAASMGFVFAAVSTYDSAVHLDRQVHGIHCSYLLGMGDTDASGTSGCYATLMSNYSSVFRKSVWGGIPVALPGMAVFGYIGFAALFIGWKRRFYDPRAAGFLTAACLVPLLTTVFMAYVSLVELDTVCKVCMGIYVSSVLVFAGALWMSAFAVRHGAEAPEVPRASASNMVTAFALGVVFVAVPTAAYAAMAPDFSKYVGGCGRLSSSDDPGRVLIPLGPQNRPVEMIEVMDPLCAACGIFEKRFQAMSEKNSVARRVMLFPLDKQCNWMLGESVHPGACAVSEAMFCAEGRAGDVLDFVVENQQRIIDETKNNPTAAARIMKTAFPNLAGCIGSASARAKVNLALRWAVKNRLHILTPQIYIDGFRLCDEDTDLGLEYALSRLISKDFVPGPTPEAFPDAPIAVEPPPLRPRKSPVKKTPASSAPSGDTEHSRPAVSPAGVDTAAGLQPPAGGPPAGGALDLDAKLRQVNDRLDALTGTGGGASSEPASKTPPTAPAAGTEGGTP